MRSRIKALAVVDSSRRIRPFLTVRKKHDYYCVIISDVIMCVPQQAKEDIKLYCDKVRPTI